MTAPDNNNPSHPGKSGRSHGPGKDLSEVSAHLQARILAEALPHLIRYDEQTVVIKFGGNAMGDQALADAFAQDIVYLKQSGVNPIVVHGGGPQIAAMLKKLEIKSDFIQGLRVTDKPTVDVVEMVLAGAINKQIVLAIIRLASLPQMPTALPPCRLIADTISLLIAPANTISTTSTVGLSVTRNP